jgi:outer membrane protein assembly factor BamD
MKRGDYFFASKKFSEAEVILPKIEFSAKASLMSSYCLYLINFYSKATDNLERFITQYPTDKNVAYAHYLIAITLYEQILDEKKDINPLISSKEKIFFFLETYPDTEYAIDLQFKLDLINNQLAAKELYIAKYYITVKKWIPAINRLKTIVNKYNETIFIEEALHRMVEIYYKIGLEEEAKSAAVLLGYNYNSSIWYEKSYKILNKNYKIPELQNRKENQKENGLITRTIKKLTKW